MKVRFLAWQETKEGLDLDNGHLTMMDFTDGIALEYGWIGPKTGNVQGLSQDFRPVPKHDTEKKPLYVVGMDDKSQISWQTSKLKPKTTTRRFKWVFWLDVDITDKEMKMLEYRAGGRTESGNYVFKKEEMTSTHDARCLTVLEDLAKMRQIDLGIGTALTLLKRFARLTFSPGAPSLTVYGIAVDDYKGLQTNDDDAFVAAMYSPYIS
jgi:hypothetical protein